MTKTQRRSALIGCATLAVAAVGALPSLLLAQQGWPASNALSIPAHQIPNAAPSVGGPLPQPQTSLEVPSLKLRSQPGYEQVTVTVTDSSGKYIADLKEDDFRVLEDGQQRPIGFFRLDRAAPASVGIVVDCSGSMDSKLWQARTAITRMVNDLDSRDDIFLESFSDQAELLQPFTSNHTQIIEHLKFLHSLAHTALYDAIYMGLYEMRRASHDKRVLLVVTDGMDNVSSTMREQVIAAARGMKVLIYTIGIGDKPGAGSWSNFDDEEVDMPTLNALSEETGAKAFHLPRIGDGAELAADCQAISNELIRQYTIAYLSPDPGRIGYRSLRVDVTKHPELSVRVRKSVAVIPH